MKIIRGMVLLGAVAGMTGCASIGPPEAPSLELPKPPSDLHAATSEYINTGHGPLITGLFLPGQLPHRIPKYLAVLIDIVLLCLRRHQCHVVKRRQQNSPVHGI